MLPLPTSRVFRSRRGALKWSFWVIVAAVMAVGFSGSEPKAAHPTDDQNVKELLRVMNAM